MRAAPAQERPVTAGRQLALAAYWFTLNFETASLGPIVLPLVLDRVARSGQAQLLARIMAAAALVAMVVPPLAGALSDGYRRRNGRRTPLVWVGSGVNLFGLLWLARAAGAAGVALGFLTLTAGQNIALGAYEALMPDRVPRQQWGVASGYMGVATLTGTVGGLVAAGLLQPSAVYTLIGLAVVGGSLVTSAGVGEEAARGLPTGSAADDGPRSPGGLHDFAWAFAARALVMLGLTLLMTFIYYYFQDVLHVQSASTQTAAVAVLALGGAMVATFVMGQWSDRLSRRAVVSAAGIPMALAAIGFALWPQQRLLLGSAVVYGLGYGAYLSVDWALGLETVPTLEQVGRTLGIWGIAANLPSVIAPLVGGAVLARAATAAAGYRDLFLLSGACFVAGSVVVQGVGRPEVTAALWRVPFRLAVASALLAYVHLAYRVRWEGPVPRRRGCLVLGNHVHDLETLVIPPRLALALGLRWGPLYFAASRRMLEPGLLRERVLGVRRAFGPLEWLLDRIPLGPIVLALGMLPLENQPRVRPLRSLAYDVYTLCGDLPLQVVFEPRVLQTLPPRGDGARLSACWRGDLFCWSAALHSLQVLREPYRGAVRQLALRRSAEGLSRLQQALRQGATVFLTPEGQMTRTGELGRLRAALDRALRVTSVVYLTPVAYDPFVPGRLRLVVRVVPLLPGGNVRHALLTGRAVTASQLVASALSGCGPEGCTAAEVVASALERLRRLPPILPLDPALRRRPEELLWAAVRGLRRRGLLRQTPGGRLVPAPERRDPRFPLAEDIIRHQAAFLAESLEAARQSRLAGA